MATNETKAAKFTPGDWFYVGGSEVYAATDAGDVTIARVDNNKPALEYLANGRLIAQAPAMYALLKKLSEQTDDANAAVRVDIDDVLAAINGSES